MSPDTALEVGDVVIHEGVDLLLTGALSLRDGPTEIATIFFASLEKGALRLVVAFPRPRTEILWLKVTPPPTGTFEPPLVLELEAPISRTLDRTRRLAVTTDARGGGVPALGSSVAFAEYGGIDARAIVVVGQHGALVAAGESVRRDAMDRLPGS